MQREAPVSRQIWTAWLPRKEGAPMHQGLGCRGWGGMGILESKSLAEAVHEPEDGQGLPPRSREWVLSLNCVLYGQEWGSLSAK